jgi:hypothetical protein
MTETKVMNGKTYFRNPIEWVKNDWLDVESFIRLLFAGVPYSSLPVDIQKAVTVEMLKRHGTTGQKSEAIRKFEAMKNNK